MRQEQRPCSILKGGLVHMLQPQCLTWATKAFRQSL